MTGRADTLHDEIPDALPAWMAYYLTFAVVGVRSPAVAEEIALHLERFILTHTWREYCERQISLKNIATKP